MSLGLKFPFYKMEIKNTTCLMLILDLGNSYVGVIICSSCNNSLICTFFIWPFDVYVLNFQKFKNFLKEVLKKLTKL